jgi:hypothetical protein
VSIGSTSSGIVLSTGPGTPSHGMIDLAFDIQKACSEVNELMIAQVPAEDETDPRMWRS